MKTKNIEVVTFALFKKIYNNHFPSLKAEMKKRNLDYSLPPSLIWNWYQKDIHVIVNTIIENKLDSVLNKMLS